MKGLFYLLAAYLAGEVLSVLTGRFMPASVFGMLVLFLALRLRAVKTADVRIPSKLLLDNMALFFVPAGVGLITAYALIRDHLWAILVALVVSTALVIVFVGRLQQRLNKKKS